jgi:hypothetical protein
MMEGGHRYLKRVMPYCAEGACIRDAVLPTRIQVHHIKGYRYRYSLKYLTGIFQHLYYAIFDSTSKLYGTGT